LKILTNYWTSLDSLWSYQLIEGRLQKDKPG
jgi:hypothetical protein